MTTGNSDATLISGGAFDPEATRIAGSLPNADATLVAIKTVNPFVGPRSFEARHAQFFYGRDEETAILEGVVMSSRAALFFAQSGAGKSSLLRAGLIPNLTRQTKIGRGPRAHLYQKMLVFPIVNVSGGEPAGLTKPVANLFMFNALTSLFPPEEECDNLADMDLVDAMACLVGPPRSARAALAAAQAGVLLEEADSGERPSPQSGDGLAPNGDYPVQEEARRLLIFDQFEELFTHYPERWREREAFFKQVNKALDEYPSLHVLFTMREDFIAELTPYCHLLPQDLRARFRLELLKRPAALRAVIEPVQQAGRAFAPGVAESLVNNLSRSQAGRASQAEEIPTKRELGEYVEPVHLQIVCRQLWEKLPRGRIIIQASDVETFGDVDHALMGFYETTLASVLEDESLRGTLSPRHVRDWFDEHLITPARTRGLVYRGEHETEGLPNAAVGILNNAYIIRARVQGPDTWYELAHDRLVGPVLQANVAWRLNYKNPLERAARAWLEAGRSPEKLLDGVLLKEAAQYAQDNPADVLPAERELLEESARQQTLREELARQKRMRRRWTMVTGAVVILILAILSGYAMLMADSARASEARARESEASALENARIAQEKEESARISEANAIASEESARASEENARASEAAARESEQRAEDLLTIALAGQLAGQSMANLDNQYDLALLLGLEAGRSGESYAAEESLFAAVYNKPYLSSYLSGHTDGVLQVKYSPDGDWLASAGNDNTVRIWEVDSRQEDGEPLVGHTERVNSLDWSPDGSLLASASDDGTFIVWDSATGEMLYQVDELPDWNLTAIAFHPAGSLLAVTGSGDVVYLWDLEEERITGELVLPDYNYVYPSRVLSFNPDGSLLAMDGGNGELLLWNVDRQELERSIFNQENDILAVDFSPDGRMLASGGYDMDIWITDLENNRDYQISPSASWLWSLAFSPDGQQLAASFENHTLQLWNIDTSNLDGGISHSRDLTGHAAVVASVDFPSQGNATLASGSWDGKIILWDMNTTYPLGRELYSPTGMLTSSIAQTSDGAILASGSEENGTPYLTIWDVQNGEALDVVELPMGVCPQTACTYGINALAFSPNDQLLAVGDQSGNVNIWDMQANGWRGEPLLAHAYQVFDLLFTPDGSLLISAGDDNVIMLWEADSLEQSGEPLAGHTIGVTGLAITRDGKRLYSSSWDSTLRVWDLETRQAVGEPLRGHSAGVMELALSHDELILASAGMDHSVRLWDVSDPTYPSRALFGHLDSVHSLDFSSDDLLLASTDWEGFVIVWDLITQQPFGRPLNGFQGPQLQVLFAQDDLTLFSSSRYGVITEWDLDPEHWRDAACGMANRSLTSAELEQFLFGEEDHTPVCP